VQATWSGKSGLPLLQVRIGRGVEASLVRARQPQVREVALGPEVLGQKFACLAHIQIINEVKVKREKSKTKVHDFTAVCILDPFLSAFKKRKDYLF
jgi:hypothetical protein